ncbi:MAG: DNA replication/repair protein RecF [Gammaproteobacteria bacterium CG11_big_fil_rev_8_21_14_0_20_46_22]|nr:MAG: DNA replication/repair protein RecF [Gammaproteobacteria bacterium CG12_big_fil_rev_8_21_14_0_65_46_12]PIR10985.1 MAG: DNA replication/repair protein RecF [Gammaproteobacteria bacterium CG11_big_fil_rev_8_21_14_0_20_46_22]
MTLKRLTINHFRNLTHVSLNFCPNFNLFYGDNGSGKTSLFEAIYYLSTSRSFRNHINQRVIAFDQPAFTLFAECDDSTTLGIQKSLTEPAVIKLSGEKPDSVSQLARVLPMVLLNYDSFDVFMGGSQKRRHLLDWLLFHVEPQFFAYWSRYQKALKQRNKALKMRLSEDQVTAWDDELVAMAENIDHFRQKYWDGFVSEITRLASAFLPGLSIVVTYKSGAKAGCDFKNSLAMSLAEDYQRGFTYYGAHRADLLFKTENGLVKDVFSRGQQKALLLAVSLAQFAMYSAEARSQNRPLVLVDDIAAELDQAVLRRMLSCLRAINAQVFISVIEQGDVELELLGKMPAVFHVERGEVKSV